MYGVWVWGMTSMQKSFTNARFLVEPIDGAKDCNFLSCQFVEKTLKVLYNEQCTYKHVWNDSLTNAQNSDGLVVVDMSIYTHLLPHCSRVEKYQ